MVPRCGRTDAVVEPMLTDQWFVKMESLAQRALDVVARGEIKFVPENWTTTYNQWLQNIQDWCISRQLWWGHRIPAWYDAEGNVYVARTREEAPGEIPLGARLARGERRRAAPGRGRPRYLVLLGAMAFLDARLDARLPAPLEPGARSLSAVLGARHRLRHHFLLGGAHGHDDAPLHRQSAFPRGLHHRPRARRRRPEDVEVERQHPRSARHHRRHHARRARREAHDRAHGPAPGAVDRGRNAQALPERHTGVRHRRIALHFREPRFARPRHQVRSRALRRLSQLLQQALERHALRADELRRQGRRARRGCAARASRSPTAGS